MMLTNKLHVVVLFLEMCYLFCKGDQWNKYLYFNETSLEDNQFHFDDSGNFIRENGIREKMKTGSHNEFSEKVIDLKDDLFKDLESVYTDIDDTIIKDLRVTKATADSLTIKWFVDNENASLYRIEWSKNNEAKGSVNGSYPDLIYTINELESCSEYKITVTPIPGEAKETNGKTSKTQPGPPLILTADPTDEEGVPSLFISWKKPTGDACIKTYKVNLTSEIYGKKHSFSETTDFTSFIAKPLYACASYLVEVKAIDLDGGDGLASTIQSKPTPKKVSNAPKLSNGVIGWPAVLSTRTTIMLSWNVRDTNNNCSIESVVSECFASYSDGYGFEIKEYGTAIYTVRNNEIPKNLPMTVTNLSPYTYYFCKSWTVNVAGNSSWSFPVPMLTKEDVPSQPEKFQLLDETNFTFSWEAPNSMPGHLNFYRLTVSWEPLYPVPSACKVQRSRVIDNILPIHNNYTWTNGEGFSKYTAYIEARTAGGWGPASKQIVFSSHAKGVPDQITNFKYETKPTKKDPNVLETILSWQLPCSLRGELQYFELSVDGTKKGATNHSISAVVGVSPDLKKDEVFSINLGELRPQYRYRFEVTSVLTDSRGEIYKYIVMYPDGIPPQPTTEYLRSITLDPSRIQRTSTSFEVLLPLFPNINGKIKCYAIIISRRGFPYKSASIRFDLQANGWPNISSWKESKEADFTIPYQASEPNWTPYPNYILDYGSIKAAKVQVGEDETCNSLVTKSRLYCNGPLKPDTWYEVRMRAFTNAGYTDSAPITVKTDAEISVALIIGIVFGVLFLGVAAALLLAGKSYFKRKEENTTKEESSDQYRYRNRRLTMNARAYSHDTSSMSSAIRTK